MLSLMTLAVLSGSCGGNPTRQVQHTLDEALAAFDSPPAEPDRRPAGATYFDFLHGSWSVRNRTLRARLAGSDEWDEWDAELDVIPILQGYGNVDRFRAVVRGEPYEGMTVRVYDPETDRWSMSWVDNRLHRLIPQVGGRMEGWGGEFYGAEEFEGDSVQIRFRWTHEEPGTARWEQAYLTADGAWETNWTMDFERRAR